MKAIKPKSMSETLRDNAKAHAFLAAQMGKEVPEQFKAPEAVQRKERVQRTANDDLEATVMREVSDVLAVHPRVLFAVRQNSGSMQVELSGGKTAPMWFYRWARSRVKMRISDYWGLTTDGRMFAFECKRRTWTKPSGEREGEQLAFLLTVKNSGGIAAFVTSGERVMELLNTP